MALSDFEKTLLVVMARVGDSPQLIAQQQTRSDKVLHRGDISAARVCYAGGVIQQEVVLAMARFDAGTRWLSCALVITCCGLVGSGCCLWGYGRGYRTASSTSMRSTLFEDEAIKVELAMEGSCFMAMLLFPFHFPDSNYYVEIYVWNTQPLWIGPARIQFKDQDG